MTNTEANELLRLRRALTGETYNDETVAAWKAAFDEWQYTDCRDALVATARTEKRITVADIAGLLSPSTKQRTGNHPPSCMCEGRGWIEVEQHDDHGSWAAWDRCPNGPRSGFVEVDT